MPLVQVLMNDAINEDLFSQYANGLRDLVAGALTCDDAGGNLASNDIEVSFRIRDENRDFDGKTKYDVQITVFANYYPLRQDTLQDRTDHINRGVVDIFPGGLTGYVWVLLAPAGFSEFGIDKKN